MSWGGELASVATDLPHQHPSLSLHIEAFWENYLLVMTLYVMFCTAIVPSLALMAYWTCPFSWLCESPSCTERSYDEQLTASWTVRSRSTTEEFVTIHFPVNRNIPSSSRNPSSGRRKQMPVLEQRQHVEETRDLDGEQGQRGRTVCFLDGGGGYKQHTSWTETWSQSQSLVRQTQMQHCSFLKIAEPNILHVIFF